MLIDSKQPDGVATKAWLTPSHPGVSHWVQRSYPKRSRPLSNLASPNDY